MGLLMASWLSGTFAFAAGWIICARLRPRYEPVVAVEAEHQFRQVSRSADSNAATNPRSSRSGDASIRARSATPRSEGSLATLTAAAT